MEKRKIHFLAFNTFYLLGWGSFLIVANESGLSQLRSTASLHQTMLGSIIGYVSSLILVYYIWNVFYSIFHIVKKSKDWNWLPAVLFVPAVGTFLYYNKFVLTDKYNHNLQVPVSDRDIAPLIHRINIPNLMYRRLAAAIVDQFTVLIVMTLDVRFFGSNLNGQRFVTGWPAWGIVCFWFAWLPLQEYLFGKTVGKRILGLSVVDKKLKNLSLWRATLRHIMDIPDILFSISMVVWRRPPGKLPRRLGDFIAGSYVVPDKTIQENQNDNRGVAT